MLDKYKNNIQNIKKLVEDHMGDEGRWEADYMFLYINGHSYPQAYMFRYVITKKDIYGSEGYIFYFTEDYFKV